MGSELRFYWLEITCVHRDHKVYSIFDLKFMTFLNNNEFHCIRVLIERSLI